MLKIFHCPAWDARLNSVGFIFWAFADICIIIIGSPSDRCWDISTTITNWLCLEPRCSWRQKQFKRFYHNKDTQVLWGCLSPYLLKTSDVAYLLIESLGSRPVKVINTTCQVGLLTFMWYPAKLLYCFSFFSFFSWPWQFHMKVQWFII